MTVADELVIVTGGKHLSGWKSARVERGVERLPSGFSLDVTEFYPSDPGLAVLEPFSPVQIYLGDDLVLTGYIDLYGPDLERERHPVICEGRSKTEDLVDCS